jgi:hypothetical protein
MEMMTTAPSSDRMEARPLLKRVDSDSGNMEGLGPLTFL